MFRHGRVFHLFVFCFQPHQFLHPCCMYLSEYREFPGRLCNANSIEEFRGLLIDTMVLTSIKFGCINRYVNVLFGVPINNK